MSVNNKPTVYGILRKAVMRNNKLKQFRPQFNYCRLFAMEYLEAKKLHSGNRMKNLEQINIPFKSIFVMMHKGMALIFKNGEHSIGFLTMQKIKNGQFLIVSGLLYNDTKIDETNFDINADIDNIMIVNQGRKFTNRKYNPVKDKSISNAVFDLVLESLTRIETIKKKACSVYEQPPTAKLKKFVANGRESRHMYWPILAGNMSIPNNSTLVDKSELFN
jgi:hypothetical protein